MIKELEVLLGELNLELGDIVLGSEGKDTEASMVYCHIMKKIELIKLTPPTAEEVCQALSEHLGTKVYYNAKIFYYEPDETYCEIANILGNNELSIEIILSPHLITMIGRFYVGELNSNTQALEKYLSEEVAVFNVEKHLKDMFERAGGLTEEDMQEIAEAMARMFDTYALIRSND